MVKSYVLYCCLTGEALQDIRPFNFLHFLLGVLLDEVINSKETAANTHHEIAASLNFDIDTLLSKEINAF